MRFISKYFVGITMTQELSSLDHTILDIKTKLSSDPDPFLIDLVKRLIIIRDNQQNILVKKAIKKTRDMSQSGFRGHGIS
jgi:hypothetical protein